MAVKATIVEQLQELRKWQTQQQEELMQQQQKQREKLSNEQNRIYNALSLSVKEINLSNQSIKKLIEQEKEEAISDLIDFDSPDEQSMPLRSQSQSFTQYVTLTNENKNENKNKSFNLREPKMQLNVKNRKINLELNTECTDSFNQHNYTSQLLVDTIQSFSSGISDKQFIPLDEIPVPSPKKDFNTLLEERLKDVEPVNIQNKPDIKRPFLKKGQGLARFRPNTKTNKICKHIERSRSASFSTCIQSNNTKASKTINLERCNSLPRSKQNDVLKKSTTNTVSFSQPKLTIKNVSQQRKKFCNKSIDSMLNSIVEKKKPIENMSDTNSSDLEIKNKRELEEIRIFELLEDKAENSSFCSTSSTVIAFLQQSTPLKHKAFLHNALKNKISVNDIEDHSLEEIPCVSKINHLQLTQHQENLKDQKLLQWDDVPESKLKDDKTVTGTILPYGTDVDGQYEQYITNQELSEDENSRSLHVRFSEHNEYKTLTDASSISSDSETITNYINNKGTWSDSSMTPDSSDIESMFLHLKEDNEYNDNKKIDSFNFLKEIRNNCDYKIKLKNEVGNEIENERENEEKNKNEIIRHNITIQNNDAIINKKNENTSLFKSQLLKTRLLELEQEIEIFRKESAALTFQQQKLQEERIKLQEEYINMQRNFKEKEEALEIEKRKTENILQEEKKRLSREKIALESRMKDAWEKAQKSKQERQEIQALRDHLEELQGEYNQKESKWSAANARQRSQMRVLQTENSKLKQDLEKIQQKTNSKFKKPLTSSNTKAIHQINKFLADRKKILPFKNDVVSNEEKVKICNNINLNDNVGTEIVEEKFHEKEIEKIKILKTAESIARTRNLYESLLKDATEDITEIHIDKRNLIDKRIKSQKKTEIYFDTKENNYNHESVKDHKYPSHSPSPKLLEVEQKEPSECDSDINNKFEQQKLTNNKQGVNEIHHPDGHIEYWYPNGNVKKIFPDKFFTKMIYYNGDVRETDKNGTIKYFYAETRTWHTTMPDGLEILEFPDGQVERRAINGTIEVAFADGSVRIVQADGSEKWALRDGTIAETLANGEKILTLPNGQREIHTKEHKRREYPDGTIKLVYPDGSQETRYANGRVRLKDKDGNLIMDTHQ